MLIFTLAFQGPPRRVMIDPAEIIYAQEQLSPSVSGERSLLIRLRNQDSVVVLPDGGEAWESIRVAKATSVLVRTENPLDDTEPGND